MTNIFLTPEKRWLRDRLSEIAIEALERDGWKVEPILASRMPSVRRITKGTVQKTVSIRTTQNTSIAFPRNSNDDAWATLADVDYVVASSVDKRDNPEFAQVHLLEGNEMRARFDRAYAARRQAGYTLPVGRGIWLSLYEKEASNPVTLVGAGAGLDHPAIATVPLAGVKAATLQEKTNTSPTQDIPPRPPIAEAKRWLALALGVNEADIKITISG